MAGSTNTEELLRRLDEQHKAYIETFRLVHEALSHSVSTNTKVGSPVSQGKRRRRSTIEHDSIERPYPMSTAPTQRSIDSDFSDEDEDLYVQESLPSYKFDDDHLKQHLRTYKWKEGGRKVLEDIDWKGNLFPKILPEGSHHHSHYSIFDVGRDGAPLSRRDVVSDGSHIDSAIWQAVKDLNANPDSQRPTVGRISIIREPNPVIFGALHLTMNPYFDMDEIFSLLVSSENSAVQMADRAYSSDERHQRSFVFSFDYYTVIGHDCAPMGWQLKDNVPKKRDEHIPISKCNSVVALSLSGKFIRKTKNAHRRAKTQEGYIYNPWAPWHVLNIQCYPDHKHSMDSHDSTKHYVNGPEAFLTTLLAEFKDAQKRFEEIYNRITRLVTPRPEFMFSRDMRDELLFEDPEFTYSRRYFWAFQTLGMMNSAIKAIIDSYEKTFTDDVWDGKHKVLWPMLEATSPRNVYWKKRMAGLKKDFEKEIQGLQEIYDENDVRRKEIRTLRDQLFSGTSVLESRKSVDMAAVTILQGHNIKLLTLVSIFFLPLTFVTSVFGMTNIPSDHWRATFAIVMVTVCIPFFLLIGSLNTTSGMKFWRGKWKAFIGWLGRLFGTKRLEEQSDDGNSSSGEFEKHRALSLSTSEGMDRRLSLGGLKPKPSSVTGRRTAGVAASTSSAQFGDDVTINPAAPDSDEIQANGGKEANDTMVQMNSGEKGGETQHIEQSWLGTFWGRKRKGRDRDLDV